MRIHRLASAAILAIGTGVGPVLAQDFGLEVEALLAARSMELFGLEAPLAASAVATAEEGYRTADQGAGSQIALAGGLSAEYLTREAADSLDMMTFYPADAPTHLIGCIEGEAETLSDGRLNPSVQSIDLATGAVTTLLRGMTACDGIRTTPWGTIIATEEEDDGAAYEIMDPLALVDVALTDRAAGTVSDPAHVAKRTALPTMAWEGFAITPEGVVYGGDELRPGTDASNADGGAMYKFVPTTPHAGGMLASLDASPLVGGTTYAMQVQCVGGEVQFGQGCETGNAGWFEVDPAAARVAADAGGATGYYRPEDLHADPAYAGEGIRFCWANTGNEGGSNFAEVMCAVDTAPLEVAAPDAEGALAMTTTVSRFLEGGADANSFDNLDFQPGTGILYVIEDHPNGDIWACLPDGADDNLRSDGCIRAASVMDTSAEPTGLVFDATGALAYVSIQHSEDAGMPPVDGYGTDDLVRISGFALPATN